MNVFFTIDLIDRYRQPKFSLDLECTKFQLKREHIRFCKRLGVIV